MSQQLLAQEVIVDPVRVLIIDDSADQRFLLQRYFERAGCDVVVASNGIEAIAAYDESTPDLTVIDLVLPGMSGWDLAARFRSGNPDGAIAISSVLSPDQYPEHEAALTKPVTGEHVRKALRDCVPRWEAAA
jgi:CheY-like chemotaxis protein